VTSRENGGVDIRVGRSKQDVIRDIQIRVGYSPCYRTKDEYTIRISAHAQQVVRKGRQVLSEQPYVTPFEEYWTFGRMDDTWKLKEVLPPAGGEKLITEENVDEDSSAGQMQWYYRETRAV
jgi:hypothetical protein